MVRTGEDRHRSAVAARAVHLPPDRAIVLRYVEDLPRGRRDERLVQVGLRLGVADHRGAERIEVAREQRVPSGHGLAPQRLELVDGRAAHQTADHLLVNRRRVVGAPEEDHRETRLEFGAHGVRDLHAMHGRMRILVHVDEADAAVRRAELVLDAALLPQVHRLHLMRLRRQFVRRKPVRRKAVKRPQQRDRDCGRRTGGRAARNRRMEGDLDVQSLGDRHRLHARLEQRVAVEHHVLRIKTIPVAVVVHREVEPLAPRRHLRDLHAAFGVRAHRDVEHGPVLGEPRVRPAAQVADADRRENDECLAHSDVLLKSTESA